MTMQVLPAAIILLAAPGIALGADSTADGLTLHPDANTQIDTVRFATDLLLILAAGLVAGLTCRWFKISMLLGYLVAGVAVGKILFLKDGVHSHEIEYLAEIGVFFLLFSIGLEFSLDDLARLGRHFLVGGPVQLLLAAVPVLLLLIALGSDWKSASIVGAAIAFSSTVLVFRSLAEWGKTDSPVGRRAIAILLFQDVALIPLLLVVPMLTGRGPVAGPFTFAILAGKTIGFVVGVIVLRKLLARFTIPLLARFRSPELVILLTVVVLAAITLGAYALGLPPAIGAFAAGLVFSGNRWTAQVDAMMLPFRETFSAVFFVSLGMLLDPAVLLSEPLLLLGLLAGVIGLKFVAGAIALQLTGLSWRDSSGMGLGLAHVGEFAFVLLMLGLASGVVTQQQYDRVLFVAIGSLMVTPLLLKWGLRYTAEAIIVEEPHVRRTAKPPEIEAAVVIGAGPVGRQAASQLEMTGRDVCVVDLSPVNLHGFAQQGFRTVAGDATTREVLVHAHADRADQVVVSVPDDRAAIKIVEVVRDLNPAGRITVRCRYQASQPLLRRAGADAVVSEEIQAMDAVSKCLADEDRLTWRD